MDVLASPRRPGAFSALAGGALTFALAAAPLAYACTRPDPLRWLTLGLHIVAGLWILALLIERRRPAIPTSATLFAVAALAYVALRWALGTPLEPDRFTSTHFARAYARWPESMILRTDTAIAALASGFVLTVVVASDLGSRRIWKKIFAAVIVVSGVAVVAIGLWQNYRGVTGIYGELPVFAMPSAFFGPFYHFTSAGAFINLTWPIALSLALQKCLAHFQVRKPLWPALLWGVAGVALLVGHAGHVSRFPQVIAVTGLMAIGLFYARFSSRAFSSRSRLVLVSALTLVVFAAGFWVVSKSGRLDAIRSRWQGLQLNIPSGATPAAPPPESEWPRLMRDDLFIPYDHSNYFLHDRGAAYHLALRCFMARPIFGFGPGGWMAAASWYSADPQLRTFFHYLQFTHEDYLQTLVEWGLVGGLLFATLIFGGIAKATRTLIGAARNAQPVDSSTAIVAGALVGLVLVLIQSSFDFPLQIPANAFYASVLIGLCWSSKPGNKSPQNVQSSDTHSSRKHREHHSKPA